MVIRKIIKIDEALCDGCGNCVLACPENAIEIVGGKAKVVRESFCDGLGACIGNCPTGALSMEEREAEEFDELAAKAAVESAQETTLPWHGMGCEDGPRVGEGGCPMALRGTGAGRLGSTKLAGRRSRAQDSGPAATASQPELSNWPVQMRLATVDSPQFDGARLLIAGDCTAFASPTVHRDFIRGRTTLIGCPKLDERESFVERLAAILAAHDVEDITVLEMEVPCCSNLEAFVRQALKVAGKEAPVRSLILGIDGEVQG
ncbi:MAG: Iron-sulfur cluster-binding protein [Methanothrix harundinacea]|uniref:Iron-sulfur cluster-binding protein n=1 Tax=Methanothrix harundinacea TaxID=301375 RepID=A0A101FTV3_9EURY|nr:MAG: Iron-sulfur cluster-binding protein [Methanothrix harundinacea]